MARRTGTLRIGAGASASYAGDRIEPANHLAEHGALDYLVYETLAERTIALANLARMHAGCCLMRIAVARCRRRFPRLPPLG